MNLCNIRTWGFPSLLCVTSILAGHGISAPWFPQLSNSVVGCRDERCCHTVPPQTTSMLQCRSTGNRVVDCGFGVAVNNKGCFYFI